jgi:hypothetical protein
MQTSENANFVNFAEVIFPRPRVNNPGLKRRGTWGLLRVRGTIAEDRRGIMDALDASGGPLQVS